MRQDFDQLTGPQRKAVEHRDGPLLILAGPGSGKTRVVTHRIANLIRSGVAPQHLLALTFTNKAAEEMRRRIGDLVPGQSVWVSTFHRFCSRLLREHASLIGLAENFTILDRGDSQRALSHALEGLADLNLGQVKASSLLKAISDCKQKLITAEKYQVRGRGKLAVLLADIYPAYQHQLITANAVDFDDLLLHTVELLEQNPELRHELDERYRYVMVDEYQDTNTAQYAIARALSIDFPNLGVTGDPDQSIYGWRGADIRNILGFERDYPNTKVVRLEHNFRSTPQILACADELIRFNRQRRQKTLIPVHEAGDQVGLFAFASQQDEAQYIAAQIKAQVERGERRYRDFAIFYRINALSRYLEHTLHEYRVPFQVLNGVEFYQRKEVKDVMAYLQLTNNTKNDVAFLRVVNTPARGLGKKSIAAISDYAREHQISLFEASSAGGLPLSKRAAASLANFVEMIEEFQRYATSPVEEILGHVLDRSGYTEFIAGQDERADEDRSANIHELLSAARQFDMIYVGSDYLDAFLEQTSLVSDTDAWEDETDKVTLMTLHGSKGLEFPAVFIVAVEQGKLPHERSREKPEQLEEERRLLFVGITRAQESLTLSYAKYRDYRGQLQPTIASSFLMELPRDQMNVSISQAAVADDGLAELEDPVWDDELGELSDDELDDDATDFDPNAWDDEEMDVAACDERLPGHAVPPQQDAAQLEDVAIVTASSLAGEADPHDDHPQEPTDPNAFAHGMRVKHPDYGLGKIVALSGEGKNRTATVNFVISGEKKFVLIYSMLQPA